MVARNLLGILLAVVFSESVFSASVYTLHLLYYQFYYEFGVAL